MSHMPGGRVSLVLPGHPVLPAPPLKPRTPHPHPHPHPHSPAHPQVGSPNLFDMTLHEDDEDDDVMPNFPKKGGKEGGASHLEGKVNPGSAAASGDTPVGVQVLPEVGVAGCEDQDAFASWNGFEVDESSSSSEEDDARQQQQRGSANAQAHAVISDDSYNFEAVNSNAAGSAAAAGAAVGAGVCMEDDGGMGDEGGGELRWHEVQAVPVRDPVTGRQAVLLLQTDITARALMETRMAALTESQVWGRCGREGYNAEAEGHREWMVPKERMFPRHVLPRVHTPLSSHLDFHTPILTLSLRCWRICSHAICSSSHLVFTP